MNLYKNEKKSKFRRRSFILSHTFIASESICKRVSGSVTAKIFANGERVSEKYNSSFIGGLVNESKLQMKVLLPLKRKFALAVENSAIVGAYRYCVGAVLSAPTYKSALFFFIFAVYSSLIFLLKRHLMNLETSPEQLLVPFAVLLVSLPLLVCREPLYKKLRNSTFLSLLFVDLLMLDRLDSYDKKKNRFYISIAIILGMMVGVLTAVIPAGTMLLYIFALILLLVILHSPEAGLIAIFFVFPFISFVYMRPLIVQTLLSYMLKLFRGKRNLKFSATDVFVLLLGIYSTAAVSSEKLAFIFAVYFIAVNLIKSRKILGKCVNALVLGMLAVLLYAAIEHIADAVLREPLLPKITSVFDTPSVFGTYLSVMIPIMLYCCISAEVIHKGAFALFFIPLSAGALYLCGSDAAILTVFICLYVFYVLYTKRVIELTACFALFGILYVRFAYSGHSLAEILRHCNIAGVSAFGAASGTDTADLYTRLLSEGGIFFIGVFAVIVYLQTGKPLASLSWKKSADNALFASLCASLLAFLIIGTVYDICCEQTVFLFMLVCGLISSTFSLKSTFTEKEVY